MKMKVILFLVFILMLAVYIAGRNYLISKGPLTVVCLGNSLTAGHSAVFPGVDNKEKSYPAFLQNRINITVVNAGVSGNTTAQGLSRVRRQVLSQNPQIIIIELGANDLFKGISLSATQKNLQKIIKRINNGNRKIYAAKFYTETIAREMFTMLQITGYNEQTELINQYDSMFNSLAASNNIELIDNIWAGVWGIHMADGIHPNEEGYRIMADNYFDALKPYLEANGFLK